MSETKVYNVGDEVALLDIAETDGFFDLRGLLSGLVGKVKDYPLICEEGVECYVGAISISFSLNDILKRDPTYTDGDTMDEPDRCYYYFRNAQIGPVNLAFDPKPVDLDNTESFVVAVDEIKVQDVRDKFAEKYKGLNPDMVIIDEFVNVPPRPHNHYFKDVSHLKTIDVYRVLDLFEVDNPCIQHAVKKLLVAGGRGAKNFERDLREAVDSINRALQMIAEDENA
jgi:hypothetical protein